VARKSLCGSTLPTNAATDVLGGGQRRRRVPEWLNSFLAVQGELPTPTMYLTPSAVSLDRLPGIGIQAAVRRPDIAAGLN
jgi:hypothetical protein